MKISRHRLFSLVLFLATQAWALASHAAGSSPSLRILADRLIPSPQWRPSEGVQPMLRKITPDDGKRFLSRPADIRWDDDRYLLVAACRDGTFRLPVDDDHSLLERTYGPLPDMGVVDAQIHLGTSREFLVTAAPAHIMSWIPRTVPDPKPVSIEVNFNTLLDLDVSGDRLLVLGLQKLEKGTLAADGAIAWTAKLGKKLTEVRPVQFSISGPGAHDTDACSEMQMGKVRFLPGGSFVVVPGGEPGIFVHDASGKLVKTWQTEVIGFDAGCPISEQEMYKYSANVQARYQWLNQRRVLDELLPLRTGIGFVIRSRSNGQTRWQLKVLPPDGKVTTYDIPVTSSSEYARLAGDVRGNRIAFLLNLDTLETPPMGSQHLFIAEVPQPPGSELAKPSSAKKPLPHRSPPKL